MPNLIVLVISAQRVAGGVCRKGIVDLLEGVKRERKTERVTAMIALCTKAASNKAMLKIHPLTLEKSLF